MSNFIASSIVIASYVAGYAAFVMLVVTAS